MLRFSFEEVPDGQNFGTVEQMTIAMGHLRLSPAYSTLLAIPLSVVFVAIGGQER